MLATAVFLHMFAQAIFVSLPVLAYVHFGASARARQGSCSARSERGR